MKKILYISDESVVGGASHSGISEVVDSLAIVMAEYSEYLVYVITVGGDSAIQRRFTSPQTILGREYIEFLKVNTIPLKRSEFYDEDGRATDLVRDLIAHINPDIVHSFCKPHYLSEIDLDGKRKICTIDTINGMDEEVPYLSIYDAITTVSKAYKEYILDSGTPIGEALKNVPFYGITNGILDKMFDPSRGILLPAKFTYDNLSGKVSCRKKMCERFGIQGNPTVFLMACGLSTTKGADLVADTFHTIRSGGGVLILIGRGDKSIEDVFSQYAMSDGLYWIKYRVKNEELLQYIAGADYYLSPSRMESCGLTPIHAARYGTIPIVTQYGGLKDNFDSSCAIIVKDTNVEDAIRRAFQTENNARVNYTRSLKKKLVDNGMTKDYSWYTRIEEYKRIYKWESEELE